MIREQYLHIPNCTYTYIMSATDCTTNSMTTRMQIPLPHVPTKDVALSRYIPKAIGMGRRRRRSRRRSRGGGRPIRYDDGLSPGIWTGHPYIRTTRGDGRKLNLPITRLWDMGLGRRRRRRRHRGGGRSVGSGIGDILSKGLQTVARKGSKLVKEEATKHGSRIASSIHKKGSQLLRQGTAKAKRAAKTKVQSALKSIVNKKAPSVKRLQKAVRSITNATSSRKRSSSSPSHRRRRGRRRRRSNIGISRRSRIGLSEQSLFGLL